MPSQTSLQYQRLRRARIAQHLSQSGLAEVAGLGLRTLQRIEHGYTDPSLETLRQPAEILQTP